MNLCLDTSVVIEVFRARRPHFRRRLEDAERDGHTLQLSSLVLHELLFGARLSRHPDRELGLIEGFVSRARVSAWSAEDALSAAAIRADLAARGSQIGVFDALIAGQALNQGWWLVTSNIRDFVRVSGLTLVDWSDPAEAQVIDADTWAMTQLRRPLKEPK